MITTSSRSASPRASSRTSVRDEAREDEELRLPRPPGVFRRFWARHPVVADVLITLICLVLSLTPANRIDPSLPSPIGQILAVVVPVSVVFACATLMWRRRVPLLPFIASFAVEVLFLFGTLPGGTPLALVTSYSLAVYLSARAAWMGFGIGVGALAVLAGLLSLSGAITFQVAINPVINVLVLGLIGTLIGVNVGGRKRYLAAVIDRSRQLLVERDQQAQLAAAAERARIAREMHDIVSHSLTVIVALSEGAAATPDQAQARAAATATAETARGALTEMRAMLGVLRDDASPLPLAPLTAPSPEETVAAAQRAGYPVTLTTVGTPVPLPAVVGHAVSRIVQEGVTNAMRHAPRASVIDVRIVHITEAVHLEITNDGVAPRGAAGVAGAGAGRSGAGGAGVGGSGVAGAGGSAGAPGFGLRGLDERVAHVGGTLAHGPVDGGRWMLRAELPLDDARPGADPAEENA
ncbi:sensor histidine kinase [Microbacterium sp. NPDC008134]|uniref:sensor histidine kinase n=1 Tax=Microbacterium sp. NPDC008134 TaxID=3364183 RepID=UPI0036E7DF53